jgi:hypothetical protein
LGEGGTGGTVFGGECSFIFSHLYLCHIRKPFGGAL